MTIASEPLGLAMLKALSKAMSNGVRTGKVSKHAPGKNTGKSAAQKKKDRRKKKIAEASRKRNRRLQ